MSENVCKFCGAAIFGGDENIYQCGSWMRLSSVWVQSWMCQERCVALRLQHEQTIESLQRRIAKAIEAARLQARWSSEEFVSIVEAKALDLVIAILEGKQ